MSRRFAVLAGDSDPLFGYYLEALESNNIFPSAIIIDRKTISEKNLTIFKDRTANRIAFKPPPKNADSRYYFVDSHNDIEAVELIRSLKIDFLVSAGVPRILKHPILHEVPFGILNSHPGLLPEFRGCSCVEWAIYLDKPLGVTVHRMSESIDEGPILLKRKLLLEIGDCYEDVRVKMYMAAASALAEAAAGLVTGQYNESDFKLQLNGNYFPPIPPKALEVVKNKLANGEYLINLMGEKM